jgi:hypothetical protein
MDIVYLFRHSKFDDVEIQYSLRSVAENLTWARKVWVFGDRPGFLSDDKSRIEHVPWEAVAWLRHAQAPVRNFFLQCFLVAQHPDVDAEFRLFCEDYILLDHVTEAVARRDRFLQDLSQVTERGSGVWKQTLWRTHDWLRRLGYGGLNFETHTPMFLTKKRVFEAYRDLHDYVTEDRFFGMLGPTGILSHAYKQERFALAVDDDVSRPFRESGHPNGTLAAPQSGTGPVSPPASRTLPLRSLHRSQWPLGRQEPGTLAHRIPGATSAGEGNKRKDRPLISLYFRGGNGARLDRSQHFRVRRETAGA